jgi:hypothetical protein
MPGRAGVRLALALTVPMICGSPAQADTYPHCPDPARRDYDVIVVGAGTSGIMASIQAARLGASVALIEETNMIGGQVAAGVAGMDGGAAPPVLSGLYGNYRDRIHKYYAERNLQATTCFWGGGDTCSSPTVSAEVFWDMLDELVPAGGVVCPFVGKKVVGVQKVLDRGTGVTTSSPTEAWTSHVVIDATEYGDLIDDAGAAYRIGRARVPPVPGTPVTNNCIQDITYVAVVRDYLSSSASPDILQPPGYYDWDTGAQRVTQLQAAVNESPDGAPQLPADCPLDWDGPREPWGSFGDHNGYRAIPDLVYGPMGLVGTRTAVNYVNDYPGYWIESCTPTGTHWRGKLSADFIENAATRATLACEAKKLTLQLLYHMQAPDQKPTWGIADDEYSGSPNVCVPDAVSESRLPAIPYVRESRRIVGIDTLTGKEIQRGDTPSGLVVVAANNPLALAVGDYRTDVHNCDDPGDYESVELGEERGDRSTNPGPFQIPFGTFIPQTVDGYLPAEKNLAYTRLSSSAARVQPTTMRVGQAAGALAALSALSPGSVQPRQVRVLDVQKTLLAEDAALARETFDDVPIGHSAWRDVQIVATREVMRNFQPTPQQDHYFFNPNQEPEASEVNDVLARLFPVNPPTVTGSPYVRRKGFAGVLASRLWGTLPPEPASPPIFLDVPQNYGCFPGPCLRGAIERLYTEGYVLPCTTSGSNKWFCPTTGWEKRGWLAHTAAQVMYTTWP